MCEGIPVRMISSEKLSIYEINKTIKSEIQLRLFRRHFSEVCNPISPVVFERRHIDVNAKRSSVKFMIISYCCILKTAEVLRNFILLLNLLSFLPVSE